MFLGDLFVGIQRNEVRCRSGHDLAPMLFANILCFQILGDLYGGAHYSPSSSANLTPQGRAIQNAAIQFGNGETLPFTPCKKGYIPVVNATRMYACPLHTKERQKRVKREKDRFRVGELDLNTFWTGLLHSGNSSDEPNVRSQAD